MMYMTSVIGCHAACKSKKKMLVYYPKYEPPQRDVNPTNLWKVVCTSGDFPPYQRQQTNRLLKINYHLKTYRRKHYNFDIISGSSGKKTKAPASIDCLGGASASAVGS